MSASYIGYQGENLITETTYTEDKDGLATYTQKTLRLPVGTTATPSMSKTIMIGGETLKIVSANVVSSSSFREITEVFQGQGATRTLQQDAVNSTAEEPIETNHNFFISHDDAESIVTLSGGALTFGSQINALTGGAVFDDNGKFLYFNKRAKYNLFGVTSYLNPNLTYRRSFTTTTTPDLSTVGRIVTPSDDFPTSVSATWLCTSIQYVQRGKTFQVSHDFRSSDKKGWNTYIYGPATDPPDVPS